MASESLAVMVRRLRDEIGMTQQELAAAAGISRPWLVQIEKGDGHPSRDIVLRLARALEVPREFLMRAAGYLGPREHFPDPAHDPIVGAIRHAHWMTQRDKEVLLTLYRHCFGPPSP